MFSINNIEVDPILDGDIARKSFLKDVLLKADSSVKNNLQHGAMPASSAEIGASNYCLNNDGNSILRLDQDKRPIQPLQQHANTIVLCDGSPGALFRHMSDEKEIPDSIHCAVGGFHTFKEFILLYCNKFRSSHLELLVSHWRDTEGKLEWFLHPSDPRQFQAEASQMLLAHYAVAIHATCEHLQTSSVSAEDVETFMLDRASKYAAAFEALLSLRFLEAIFMMQDSERENGLEMFLTARKFLTLLGSVSGARNYVNINTADDAWWSTASEADRLLFEEFVYVQKTRKNTWIWSDRFVEWMVREVRKVEGKYWYAGKLNSLEVFL
jgi:hypothetical protein